MGTENGTTIEYKSKDGIEFKIRGHATRRDQSQMNIAMGGQTTIEDGKVIRTNVLALFPWLFETFVVGWSGGVEKTGRDILNAIYAQPADPTEDLVMVVGSYIFNHVQGLTLKAEDEAKKKGSKA
jgi:hypothetical protein